jgi:uncharacterized protein involved in outer membrane biogenesis
MARIRRMEANLALWPLLSGDIAFTHVAIEGADILLEQRPDGAANWDFHPAPRDSAPAAASPGTPPAPDRPRRRIAIGVVNVTDSRITLPDPRLGTVAIEAARLQGLGSGGPETFTARLGVHGSTLAVIGEVPNAPAPIRATISTGGNHLNAQGRPGAAIGFEAAIPDYAALRPLLAALAPDMALPATLPPITATLQLGPDLRPASATLQAGEADLAAWRPGLRLARLTLAAPALDQPAEVKIEASQSGLPVTATLRLDRPAALLPWAAEAPLGVTLQAEAAGARAEASGTIQQPRRLEGAAFDLRLTMPDMLALAPLLPDPLPLRDATITARVTAEGALRGPLRIEALRIDAPALVAEGEMRLTPGKPFGIDGRLAAERIDLDALARRLPAAPAAAAAPSPAPAPAATPSAPAAPPPAATAERYVIPDIALPLAALATWHGQLDLRATQIRIEDMDWRDLHAAIAQEDDVLRIAPLTVTSPGGPVQGELRLDRTANPPTLALTLRSQGSGLDLGALRRARGEPPSIEGRAQVSIEATAYGATTRALAASLTGELGLAMVDARLARDGLLRLGPELMALLVPGAPPDGLALRCLALRVSAEDGIATTGALLTETSVGEVSGVAAVNLRSERIAARLLPDVQLFGVRVRAPVGIGGTLSAPRIGLDPGRALQQAIGDTEANRLWHTPSIDWLRGQPGAARPSSDCAEQLRLARMGADGPAPSAAAAVPAVPRELQGTAQELLRGLFGGQRR